MSRLTQRERQVLEQVAEGKTGREVGVTLGISENTVKVHLAHAFNKLGALSRAQAVAIAIRSGEID